MRDTFTEQDIGQAAELLWPAAMVTRQGNPPLWDDVVNLARFLNAWELAHRLQLARERAVHDFTVRLRAGRTVGLTMVEAPDLAEAWRLARKKFEGSDNDGWTRVEAVSCDYDCWHCMVTEEQMRARQDVADAPVVANGRDPLTDTLLPGAAVAVTSGAFDPNAV